MSENQRSRKRASPPGRFCLPLLVGFLFTGFVSNAQAVDPMPVATAKHGFSSESAYQLRQGFSWETAYGTGDHNLYSFLHWEEFVDHNSIARMGSVSTLEPAPLPSLGEIQSASSLGEMTLDAVVRDPRSRIQGFVVVQHGKVLYEAYPGMREWDHHLWFSVSKTITALLLGLLEEEGKIDVEKTVESYLSEFAQTNWRGIRVIDVLDMASGLDILESEQARNAPGNSVNYFFMQEIGFAEGPLTSDQILQTVGKRGDAGQVFEYSSLNTRVLGMIVERVAKQRMADLITERVWSKLGAEGDALVALNPQGQAGMYGLFSSRLRDLARYGMLYTPSWNRISAERVVSQSLLSKIQTGCRPHIFENRAPERLGESDHFRPRCNSRQWDAVFDDGDIYKGGARGQGLYVSPSRDLVVAWFSTTAEQGWQHYARAIAQSLDSVSSQHE